MPPKFPKCPLEGSTTPAVDHHKQSQIASPAAQSSFSSSNHNPALDFS